MYTKYFKNKNMNNIKNIKSVNYLSKWFKRYIQLLNFIMLLEYKY